MKRVLSVLTIGLFCLQAGAFAAERGSEEYQRLVEYKRKQREERSRPASAREKNFWQREAERSGFAGTAAMFGNAISDAIPLDKPNSRKSA